MAKKRLGRGLGALFPQMTEADEADAVAPVKENATVKEGAPVKETAQTRESTAAADRAKADTAKSQRMARVADSAARNSSSTASAPALANRATHMSASDAHAEDSPKKKTKHAPAMRSWNSIAHPSDLFFSVDPVDVSRETSEKGRPSAASAKNNATAADEGAAVRMNGGVQQKNTAKADQDARDVHEQSLPNQASQAQAKQAQKREQKEEKGEHKPAGIPGAYLAEIKVKDIKPNPYQPRSIFDEDEIQALSDSIKEVGVLQPVVVRKIAHPTPENGAAKYELIMGERRWRASQLAEISTIPAIVRTTKDSNMLRDALLENLQRVQLNPLEEAAAYQQMMQDFKLTQEQLSKSISKSRSQIANTLRLLQLPLSVQNKVASGVLSAGHARALLALSTEEQMVDLANRIVREGLSVRTTEELVALNKRKSGKQPVRTERKDYWAQSDLPHQLEDYYNTRVTIKGTPKKGRIEIVFSSEEDLKRISDILMAASAQDSADDDGWQ